MGNLIIGFLEIQQKGELPPGVCGYAVLLVIWRVQWIYLLGIRLGKLE